MTRSQKGNYRAKHPDGTQVDDSLRNAVSQTIVQGRIACNKALAISERLNVSPLEVGKAIDLQEGRIHACQLGLFGYGAKDKRVKKSTQVSATLETAIKKALVDNRLRCGDAWHIADALKLKRIEVSQACEAMQVKINKCQLGAF